MSRLDITVSDDFITVMSDFNNPTFINNDVPIMKLMEYLCSKNKEDYDVHIHDDRHKKVEKSLSCKVS